METTPYFSVRAVTKLTDSLIYPDKFQKMKVKYATQVLSHTVVSGSKPIYKIWSPAANYMGWINYLIYLTHPTHLKRKI